MQYWAMFAILPWIHSCCNRGGVMGARFRSWWQQIKQYRVTILVITIVLIIVIALIIVGYSFDWTGFNGNTKSGKTLWDWMQLLFIPVVLAIGGYLFSLSINKNEHV
jgi:hypothetical protein